MRWAFEGLGCSTPAQLQVLASCPAELVGAGAAGRARRCDLAIAEEGQNNVNAASSPLSRLSDTAMAGRCAA